ncbi:MAG: hypothetical protein H6666_06430 [Ardenticatenaceae bacterium]|nr:hypothetical protein [Anaerolineales bacterium]MCB8917541.1 hypothetical protein [Ardenticatenaceae bacterium]
MSITVIVHIVNEDPIQCELVELPKPDAQMITLTNPRRRDGKEINYLEEHVNTMIVPWHRINFIQVMSSAEDEDIIGFVRE